jgi:ribosomal protein L37AE/L43A
MATHEIEIEAQAPQWPRVRDMPRCSICYNSMVAPEASALKSNGAVSYVWSCDSCGHAFVTQAATASAAAPSLPCS